jgi:Toprim domain
MVSWRALPYFDPPSRKGGKPKLAGRYPCIVFGTVAPDGRNHAHRIYVAAGGTGKAELGVAPDGLQRDPKKSARLRDGQSAAGCVVLWGNPKAPHLLLAEGIETAAALAHAHRAEIESGDVTIAAALSTSGVRAFVPWPATRKVTIAADRDEGRPEDDRGFKAGESAARAFALAHRERLEIHTALPGDPGEDLDWLDVLRAEGVEAVRSGIASAEPFIPPPQEHPTSRNGKPDSPDLEHIERDLSELVERTKADPGAPFECAAVVALASARHATPAAYQRAMRGLKQAGARMRDLEREIRRANLRVIEGGGGSSGFEATIEAGPYFVTPDGMIAWRKETREGVVPQPLCNFTARVIAEEVLDDGAEQRTAFVIEGELPGGHRLPPTRVPAERYPAMSWVTEAWGMAPVIFAGQGKRDHLRAAIQMLSGAVPRRTVYGHLGWRWIGGRWVFLHQGAGIGFGWGDWRRRSRRRRRWPRRL